MTFKAIVSETAKHKTTIQVYAATQAEAQTKALNGDGEILNDEVVEWMNDSAILHCSKENKRVYVHEVSGEAATLTWKDGDHERCIRTEYPMHVTLVKQLLEEAGYKEVTLNEWPKG